MASAALKLPSYKANSRVGISKDIIECAENDYLYLLRAIAGQEISRQISIGNKPTNIIVDGRGGKQVDQATRSVQVFFFDSAMLAKAVQEAYAQLQAIGRRVTGKTLGEAQHFMAIGRGAMPARVSAPTATSIPKEHAAATDFYVAVPVPHTRKWQYLSKTGGLIKRKTKDKRIIRGVKSGAASANVLLVQGSVFEKVAKAVQRKFRGVQASFVFMKHQNVNPGGKTSVIDIPAVKIYLKVKGRI